LEKKNLKSSELFDFYDFPDVKDISFSIEVIYKDEKYVL